MNKLENLDRRRIRSLPKSVADRIAAGEVVDRPVSIVKELVENSIDSGASNIIIEIKNGGKSYIRVTDNGCGIPSEDLDFAFLRHATNKIVSDEDLMSIETLGFRGEALASIAAVTRVQMITKIPESDSGTKITIEGGKVIEKVPVGSSNGTTIIATDLFFNTPAREKFLKKDATESAAVIDLISKLCLAYPEIRFKMINNGKLLFVTNGKGNVLENIYAIYGKEIAAGLFYFEDELDGMILKGYISNPVYNKTNRKHQFYFVNGRSVVNKVLEDGISKGYGDKMPEGRFPIVYVFLKIPPDYVDVNVHPNKKEVRFDDPLKIREFARKTVFNALNTELGIGKMSESTIIKFNSHISDNTSKKNQKNIFVNKDFEKNEVIQEEISEYEIKENSDNEIIFDDKKRLKNNKKFVPKSSDIEVIKIEKKTDDDTASEKHFKDMFKSAAKIDLSQKRQKVKIENTKPVFEENKKKNDSSQDEINITADFDDGIIQSEQTSFKSASLIEGEKNKKSNLETEYRDNVEIFDDKNEVITSKKISSNYKKFDVSNIEVMGVLFDTYIAAKDINNFYLIDQHAAHERVFYEKFLNSFYKSDAGNQMILTPIIFEVPFAVNENEDDWTYFLQKSGFIFEHFGGKSYIVRAIPSYMEISEAEYFLNDYIDSVSEISDFKDKKTLDKIIMRSCKSAVKAHDKLSRNEIDVLLKDLSETDNPFSCPHGRPVIIKMGIHEMEKMFKRV